MFPHLKDNDHLSTSNFNPRKQDDDDIANKRASEYYRENKIMGQAALRRGQT